MAECEGNMKFYFVRHGETDWNVRKKIQGKTDVPLNETGLAQARILAEKLVEEKYEIDRIYTSPQVRAKVTAETAAEALGKECVVLSDLAEMNMGLWEGDNWEHIEEIYEDRYYFWNSNRRYVRTPYGESYNDLLKRVFLALEYIMEQEDGNVLVLSHSAILLSMRCYLAGLCMDDETMLKFRTKNTELVEIDAEEIKQAIERFQREEAADRR